MPTLYEAALLAKHISNLKTQLPPQWEILQQSNLIDNGTIRERGYLGVAYIKYNDEERTSGEIAVVHRGTKLKLNNLTATKVSSANSLSDSSILSKKLPFDNNSAVKFSKSIHVKYADKFRIVQTGHSLGGFHAHVCGYLLKQSVIAFDPPGCREQISLLNETLDEDQLKKHFTFYSLENFVNSTNTPIGNLYKLENADYGMGKSRATFKAHLMSYIIKNIPESAADPTLPPNSVPACFSFYIYEETHKEEKIKITKRPDGNDILYTAQSCLAPNREFDQHFWLVSHINAGSMWAGHSMIVVEGISMIGRKPRAFVGYYHLIVDEDEQDMLQEIYRQEFEETSSQEENDTNRVKEFGTILTQEYDYHHYAHRYDLSQIKTWKREAGLVQRMIGGIVVESSHPIPYHFAGDKSVLYTTNGNHNCTSWALEKLELAGISEPQSLIDKIKTKPGMHTVGFLENGSQNVANNSPRPSTNKRCVIL